MSVRVAISGASGFVGQVLAHTLTSRLIDLIILSRASISTPAQATKAASNVIVCGVSFEADFRSGLAGVGTIIHCAAHAMHKTADDALAEYRAVNVAGSRRLAEHAAAAGVRRLVFVSSIKVNGEQTALGEPFLFSDAPAPQDAYGISKWEAEQVLWDISARTGLEVVVVRPPLVYGPGVKGNLARLLKLVRSGVPLPLGGVYNQRSLIGLDNLVDLLIRCVDHPAAVGQVFLVSDGEDLSTPDLLRYMAAAMSCSVRLLPVPMPLLRLAGSALGKRAEIDRLVGSLQIDSSHTRQVLGWTPPVSVEEGIRRMVQRA